MLRRFVCTVLLIVPAALKLLPQEPDSLMPFDKAYKRKYHIVKLQGNSPVIDGKLDDECWIKEGEWSDNFIQNTPIERGKPTFPTKIKLLFDNKNIFFALRAWDPEPGKINRFIGNRDDNSIGDLISVAFDTYHDFRAGTEFNINTGGNKTDLIVTDNLSINLNWNSVWEGKTSVNDSSWCAEFRIPFSQLRYNNNDTGMVWGLHVRRIIRRLQEVDQWSLIPRKNPGHIFSFGEMYGLKEIPKPRLVEIFPYISEKVSTEPGIPGSPYTGNTRWNTNGGLDAKIGAGDFTFDITINPDFGQIEADPSVLNLTAFETFYDEKRPFFLEGKHIFDFSADNNIAFYSRRIGHVPSYNPPVDNKTSFSRVPEFTNIINAVKLTGTTRNGVSVGILQSTTQKEYADLTIDDVQTRPVVEPLTNFLVARIQKTSNRGNTQLGTMLTSVNRFTDEPYLSFLSRNAFTAAVDFLQYLKNREFFIDFKGIVSIINGKADAILALQQNSVHNFQRPDAISYLGVDSTRRSLSGSGGYLNVGRLGNKKFIFSEKVSWWSPGFDLNDVGYLYMADLVENNLKLSYRETEPHKLFRNYTISLLKSNAWNFDGKSIRSNLDAQLIAMFSNRWEINLTESYVFSGLSTRLLRGGPGFRLSPYWVSSLVFNTDKSKRVLFRITNSALLSTDGITRSLSLVPGITLRLGNHIYLMSDFNYNRNIDNFIYVTQQKTGEEIQYVLARIKQKTYNLIIRLNYNITPDISIQYYGSPFISVGSYSDFKHATDTHSSDINKRYHSYTGEELTYNNSTGVYNITDVTGNYSFSQPDFSFRQFRSNLVFRWEYKPGSTIYLVWQNSRSNRENVYVSSLNHNLNDLFNTSPINVIMIKLSYWFGI
jgi:hypothetical protein